MRVLLKVNLIHSWNINQFNDVAKKILVFLWLHKLSINLRILMACMNECLVLNEISKMNSWQI